MQQRVPRVGSSAQALGPARGAFHRSAHVASAGVARWRVERRTGLSE
jgi:hypothetical protein